MSAMRRILVASIAGADQPWIVAPVAQLARESSATVTVLCVDDVESQRFETLPRGELLEQARRTAEQAAAALGAEGIEAEVAIRSGRASAAVMAYADETDADLIVVGSSTRGPVVERLLGSLPLALLQRSDRKVLVVTEPGG